MISSYAHFLASDRSTVIVVPDSPEMNMSQTIFICDQQLPYFVTWSDPCHTLLGHEFPVSIGIDIAFIKPQAADVEAGYLIIIVSNIPW